MVSRRQLLTTGVAVGASTWIAPSVLTLDRVAAATGSCVAETPAVSNGAVLISPPATMVEGTLPLDSNSNTYVWLETQAEVLDNPLTVNRTTAGNFTGSSNQNATIPAGTEIASYLVHGDRLNDNGTLTGTITFANATILGLIYRTSQLNASNFLAAPGTAGTPQQMEGSDSMSLGLTVGSNTLSWSMRFGPALDNIRVIISCS